MNANEEQIKKMTREILGKKAGEIYSVTEKILWEHEENRQHVKRRISYYGLDFSYENGVLIFSALDIEVRNRQSKLKETAYQEYFIQQHVTVENKKMNTLLEELKEQGFEEKEETLPYRTKSDDTIVFFFPKDTPEKDHAGFEICDVLIYDRVFETYFKVKNIEEGFTEIMNRGVFCRSSCCEGGYMTRIREEAVLDITCGSILLILPGDTEIKQEFSKEELAQALYDCYGKTLS